MRSIRIRFRRNVCPGSVSYTHLAEIFRQEGCDSAESCEDVETAFKKALDLKGEDGMLFCVGSLYLVGEIKAIIQREQ